MSNYTDLICDFATRTLANLDLVQQAAEKERDGAYDVTQLWNSLLGLIVAPRELDVRRLPRRTLARLLAEGWPTITTSGRLQSDTLRGLVGTLRNAVAHFNVQFHADEDGRITSVSLWNPRTDESGRPILELPHRWDGHLKIDELDWVARKIAATYIEQFSARVA